MDTNIEKGLMIIDTGFHNDSVFDAIDKKEGMAHLIPLKRNSKLIVMISQILGISLSSLHKSRYRLRSRLGLSGDTDLNDFLKRLNEEL